MRPEAIPSCSVSGIEAATQLLMIDYDTYARFLMEHVESRVRSIGSAILQMDGLQDLAQLQLLNIAALTAREIVKPRKRVHTQSAANVTSGSPGTSGGEMFWIVRGDAELAACRSDDAIGYRIASMSRGQVNQMNGWDYERVNE